MFDISNRVTTSGQDLRPIARVDRFPDNFGFGRNRSLTIAGRKRPTITDPWSRRERRNEPACESVWRYLLAACLAISGGSASARPIIEEIKRDQFHVDSGDHTVTEGDHPVPVFRQWLDYPGAAWMRLHFGPFDFGAGSYIELMSVGTGEIQRLDVEGMAEWSNSSAFFNGESVELTLFAAPGDENVFITVKEVSVPRRLEPSLDDPVGGAATICGASDNRISFSDSRVGRLGGCTGWLVSTGVVLTAGHCTDSDGDLNGALEFNVPQSMADGRVQRAALADQYPVTQWTFQDAGEGDDFCVFRVGSAADGSGRRAHIEQGFFHMTARVPPEDATMRVTGYGLDNIPEGIGFDGDPACCDSNSDNRCDFNCNSSSQTQQTATGRFDELSGDTLEYEVDTMPANSGSPVIRDSTNLAVGIHTHGGCGDTLAGDENHGTWFGDATLQNTLDDYLGANTVFVDRVNVADFEIGVPLYPARTVPAGIALVPDGGTVLIAAGSYTAAAGNTFTAGTGNKAMTLTTNTGVVTIGN